MSDKPDPACFDPYTYQAPMGPEQQARHDAEQASKPASAPPAEPAPVELPPPPVAAQETGPDPYPGGEPGTDDQPTSTET